MKKAFLWIGLTLVFLLFGREIFQGFLSDHSYYGEMIRNWNNLWLLIVSGVSAAIPLGYLLFAEKKTLKKSLLYLGFGLGIFGILHAWITGGLINFLAAANLFFNFALTFLIAVITLGGFLLLGAVISKKWTKNTEVNGVQVILSFGIGLVVFLIGMQFLMAIQLIYWPIMWILLLASGFFLWKSKKLLTPYRDYLNHQLNQISISKLSQDPRFGMFIILALISIGYFYFGFNHAYIPYPTAWDANHEYMYIPKIIAEHGGILRGNQGPAAGMPYLWHSFITFFFAFGVPLGKTIGIAPDTLGTTMNFLSGILVLILGLTIIQQVIKIFNPQKKTDDRKGMLLGWGLLLLWLTSGMGAFLVFVDNKTDLGVLTLTLLAIFAGLLFIQEYQKEQTTQPLRDKEPIEIAKAIGQKAIKKSDNNSFISKTSLPYLIISGLFFSFATMAKPTAFIDVVVFGLVLVGLWINTTTALGIGISALGAMGILQPLFTATFLSASAGKIMILIGILIVIIGITLKIKPANTDLEKASKTIVAWGIVMIAGLFIFKGPWMLINQLTQGNFDIKIRVKSTLLAQQSSEKQKKEVKDTKYPLLWAQNSENEEDLMTIGEEQNSIDLLALESIEAKSTQIDLASCQQLDYSLAELKENMQQAPGNAMNEDVGRYVGYGWREFKKTGVGGNLLALLFPGKNNCYGLNADAKLLCKNQEAINNFDYQTLKNLYENSFQNLSGEGALLLETGLNYRESKQNLGENPDPAIMRDSIVALRQYYQAHSIYSSKSSVALPYRYIVPLNVVFNRSLQNLSSYYTDIGFVWIFVFILMLGGFIYTLCQRNQKQMTLIGATIIGWALRWIIGGGIVRYGLGLIIWTILSIVILFDQEEVKEKSELIQISELIFVGLLGIIFFIQLFLNGARIASQTVGGPFEWYKSNVGTKMIINEELQTLEKIGHYKASDVLDLQFRAYLPFVQEVADRANEEGVLIAGTYLQYFLKNQWNLRLDGMLTRFWEQVSDFDSCKSYQRLKNEKIKYIVIDPNIGSIGMGEGNESLFYRFFGKLDPSGQKIQTEGAISMLIQLHKHGYLDLFYTNNLGAKYAFTLSDQDRKSIFGELGEVELDTLKAKIAVAKYFGEEYDQVIAPIFYIFQTRINTGEGIDDIANVLGKKVDSDRLSQIFLSLINGDKDIIQKIETLNQDERLVLLQHLSIYENLISGDEKAVERSLLSIIQNSIFGTSQLIILKLK